MELLTLGAAIWAAVHLIPAALPGLRRQLTGALGEGPYKGLFALTVAAGLALIIWGWRSVAPEFVYAPPSFGRTAANVLMVPAVVLFIASNLKTNLKRLVRHPQLLGVALWAVAHLLANGEQRSVVLFGALGLWAILMIVLLNRRDGPWQKPEIVPWRSDAQAIVAGVVAFAILFALHPMVIGVAPNAF